ncbi:MAG: acetate--CoA ligase family protein [Microthrixaceae bacterium]|nr:acetate--CoA ligase family protein [Microthrixaceae bacterium]
MSSTLSEADSKALLASYLVPFSPEVLAISAEAAAESAQQMGFPVAIKLCGDGVAHKTERGLVRLGVGNRSDALTTAQELLDAARPEDEATGVLVSPMISGSREFIAGVNRDPQFGPTVVFGVGGVMTEVLDDAVVRLAPLTTQDAYEMVTSIANKGLLEEFRGEPKVDIAAISEILMSLSRLVVERPDVVSVDLNPLIISEGRPIAVDALVELDDQGASR